MNVHRKKGVLPHEIGPASPGRRIYSGGGGEYLTRLLPGETHITEESMETIVTVLGSCIAACVRDPITGVGGMNHFMLPESDTGLSNTNSCSAATLYGNFAMEMLINLVLGHSGCHRSRLEIKLFGGANFADGPAMIGKRNSDFVLNYLAKEGLRVTVADLGGVYGRRIHYHPASGKVKRLFLMGASESAPRRKNAGTGHPCGRWKWKAPSGFSIKEYQVVEAYPRTCRQRLRTKYPVTIRI
jgi:chemotaxis protein CheD